MKFLEIETKYNANDITTKDFKTCIEKLRPTRMDNVGSFDYYYIRSGKTEHVLRYREGNRPELTIKKKSTDANNFVRVEVNIRLSTETKAEDIAEFARLQDYEHNFTIFKACLIYHWELHNVVYYVVYDAELKEQARFIEIELKEGHDWGTEDNAWAYLCEVERQFESLGLAPKRRLRKSLLEMFRR